MSLGKQSLLKTQNLTSEEFNSYAAYYKNVWGRIGKQPLIINSQGRTKVDQSDSNIIFRKFEKGRNCPRAKY